MVYTSDAELCSVESDMDAQCILWCRTQLAVWDMEGRLGVALAFRYPLFKALMWHAAQHYLARIRTALETGALLTAFPSQPCLVSFLGR